MAYVHNTKQRHTTLPLPSIMTPSVTVYSILATAAILFPFVQSTSSHHHNNKPSSITTNFDIKDKYLNNDVMVNGALTSSPFNQSLLQLQQQHRDNNNHQNLDNRSHNYLDLDLSSSSSIPQPSDHNNDNNNSNNNNHHRTKRTTYRTTTLYTFGIVPYTYASSVTRRQRNIIRRVIEHYQNLTCIRFVPRVSSDGQMAKNLYNLGHSGYVEFVQERNCFGGRGNNGGRTLVSCCGWDKCIHEIGHALGLVHEHINPGSKDFLRVNYARIAQAEKVRYKIAMEDEIVPGHPFDMSSPMTYTYRNDVTVLTSDISLQTKDFYMFQEISENHQCPQNNCSNFALDCVNDGYVTMIQGACACRCPPGLNPQTGCATVLSDDRTDNNKCGAVYELNTENPTVNFIKFSHQNYSCTWLINAPAGDSIVLDFHDFNVATSRSECADDVGIRLSRIGQGAKLYCGTEPPRLIRSYFNRLMLTFVPGSRPTNGSTFNVTAKLVSAQSLCYNASDKGYTYRGNVNFVRDYRKCVNWSEVAHCKHNAYKFTDMTAGLDSNFCRNPGDGSKPWCYINAATCRRQYCDVCHVDPPYDKAPFRTCRALQGRIYNLCRHGPDHVRFRCVKKCQEDLVPPQPSADTVTCSAPTTAMTDSFQVDKRNQENFTVGESVTFRCRHSNSIAQTELKKFCLSSGQWSEGTTACLPCHYEKGYTLFRQHCYKILTDKKTANQHQATCRSLGGHLADVRTAEEQEFVTDLGFEHGATGLYIGAHDMFREGSFRFRDRSPVTWTPWDNSHRNGPGKDCVVSSPNNRWYAVACNRRYQAVCKGNQLYHDRRGGRRCTNSRDDCAALLAQDPDMCSRDYGSFAFTQCPRTCRKCFSLGYNIIV